MKRLVTILAVASLLMVGPVFADCNEDPDEICIVFDYPTSCAQNCISMFGAPLSAYVVIQNPSAAGGVSGYEFMLCREGGAPFVVPPNCYLAGYVYPPNAINVATEPEFIVGLGVPLPQEHCVLLLTINMLIFCPDCWCFGVQPVPSPSIPGAMAYADGADPGNIIPMNPCTGGDWDSCTMACINCEWCPPDPPVDAEHQTWGQLKSLYD
ncbi:MAG: hypothetical protein ABIF77_06840 [bacterium]